MYPVVCSGILVFLVVCSVPCSVFRNFSFSNVICTWRIVKGSSISLTFDGESNNNSGVLYCIATKNANMRQLVYHYMDSAPID